MRLKLLSGLWFVGMLTSLWAAPLRDVPVILLQPNSDTLRCFASGDEYFNYLHDAAGYTIMRNPISGYYVYAKLSQDNLVATAFIPGRDNPHTAGLTVRVLPSAKKIAEQVANQRRAMAPSSRNLPLQAATRNAAADPNRNRGTMNKIVMYIRFADDPEFTQANRIALDSLCNHNAGLSLRTYYREMSYRLFDPVSHAFPKDEDAVVFSYQDNHPRAYYMKDVQEGYATNEERLEREQTLLRNVVEALKNQVPTNLNIDRNNDGYVDNITFIVKGNVQSAWGSLLWPHYWEFYESYATEINGKTTGKYIFLLEEELLTSGIASWCHEMFHLLGAPDLYHYDMLMGLHPVGDWDLMASAVSPPSQMGAYMKHKYGNWITELPVAFAEGTYTLAPLNSAKFDSVCYKIPSPISTGDNAEYYVVEYRKKATEGIDSRIPGSGMLIYRINPEFTGNSDYDGINNFDEVYIYRPDGAATSNGLLDLAAFNADEGRTTFDSSTNPYCFLADGSIDNVQLFGISSAGDSISFSLKGIPVTLSIANEVIYVGKMDTLISVISPPTATVPLVWSVQNISGAAHQRDEKIIGQKAGFVYVRAEVKQHPEIWTEKRIIILDDEKENPVLSYWASKGADGLLTIEAPDGISKIETFNARGSKIGEMSIGGATTHFYSFATHPRGLYFLRIWNSEGTKFSTIKTLW